MASLFDSLTQEDIDALLKRIGKELDSEGEGLDVADKKSDEEDTSVKKTDAKKTEEKSADSDTTSDSEGSTTEGESETKTDSQAEVTDKTEKKAETVTESEAKDGAKTDSEGKSESKSDTEGQTETKTDAVTIAQDGGIFGGGLTKKETDQATEQESVVPEVKSVFGATPKVDLEAQAQKAAEEQGPVTTKVAVEEAPTTTPIQEALAAAKAEEEAKAAALAAVQQAAGKSVTGDNIFSPTTVKAVQTATETGKGGDSADITEVGKIPVVTDPALIGADGGAFSGGLGKPSTNLADVLRQDITYASGYRPGQGIFVNPEEAARLGVDQGNIFLSNPNLLNAPSLTGAVPGISPGGPAVGGAGGGPVSNVQLGDQTITISFDDIVQKEIQRELDAMRSEGVFSSDPEFGTRLEVAANRGLDIYNQDVARAKELGKYIDIGPKKDPETGMPLVIPIPGLDPTTALILTAAGLIFSGGNVAKFDPNDPLGSLAGAGQGVIKTGENIIDVATGETNLGEIWKPGSTGAAPGGGGGGSATAGQQTTATGVPIPVGAGILSGVTGGGPFVGPVAPEQTTTTPAVIGVTPGAVGGETGQPAAGASPTKTKPGGDVPQTGGPGAIVGMPSAIGSGTKGGDVSVIDQQIPVVTGGYKDIPETQPPATTTVTGTPSGGTPSGGTPSGSTPSGGGGAGETPGPSTPVVVGTPPTGTTTPPATTTTTTTPPSTPIFMNDFTFTKTTPGQVALRDFEKEFNLTSSALMGEKGKELANFYQQLQSQFTPSTLTQLAGTSQQQLMSDLDRLAMAQRGQLSPEDVRSAQQSAREAYAARGQVMAPGAIGAEILNRDVLRRQREAEARANVQQSMANLGAAAQLQTGNIFAPFANLLAKTYGPTNEYANAVYDYNVNAYNAYQAAQENLAAYKEAAAKGQQAEFISTFANFLAKNGVATTWNALENIFKKISGTPGT